jgi:glycolate oxidase iron-sulfur subunit
MGLPFGASLVFRHVLTRRRLFDFTMRAASFVQRVIPGRRKGSLRHLPLFFKGGKWLPSLAKETALRRFGATPPERRGGPVWPPGIGQAQGPAPTGAASRDQKNGGKKRVGVFVGCLTNYVYPEIIGACVELLRTAGMEVVVPDGQLCCGTPALAFGEIAAARRLARRNKRCFEDANCDFVVAVCASCGRTLKQEYLYLLDSGGATLGAPVLDVCEFVSKHTNLFFTRLTEKVIYHDPCHLRWGQGVMAEPRSLLARSCAFEEIAGDMTCCGQAGTFHVFYPEIAQMLGRRKVDSLSASDASVVATGCPGCILQLNDLMAGAGNGKRALHTVEILARAVRGGGKSFGDPEGVQKGGGGTPSWVAG